MFKPLRHEHILSRLQRSLVEQVGTLDFSLVKTLFKYDLESQCTVSRGLCNIYCI